VRARRREDPRRLTVLAVHLARDAARAGAEAAGDEEREPFVVGSQSPLEDCYRPDLVPPDEDLAREHAERAEDLAFAGVDGILVETHNTVRELAAAAKAAKATGLPVFVSMVTGGAGHLLSGEDVAEAVRALDSVEPDAVGINCVPSRTLAADLRALAAAAPGVPLVAYGNLGRPVADGGGRYSAEAPPEEYAEEARLWVDLGARIVGGCCGTTAEHTAAIRRRLQFRT
jgi:methionine synthase I (cobalamin-dependent)